MNKSILVGRLVRDPEIRYSQTENGELAVASFRIAVDRKFVRKDGVKTDFFSCSAFGRLAEFADKYLLQGIKVVVTGRFENDNYKNRDGENVYSVRLMAEDIEFAESKKASEGYQEEEERGSRSSGRNEERQGSGRTSSKGRSADEGRSRGASRRPVQEEDYEAGYEDDRDYGRSSARRTSGSRGTGGRSSGGRSDGGRSTDSYSSGDRGSARMSTGSRSSGNRGNSGRSSAGQTPAGRGRSVDDEYMEAPDGEIDFD